MEYKIFVTVITEYGKNGVIKPLQIVWEDKDGSIQRFNIDKVTDVTKMASTKAGGTGLQYTVTIDGVNKTFERHLFFDTIDKLWFVENKDAPDRGGPPY